MASTDMGPQTVLAQQALNVLYSRNKNTIISTWKSLSPIERRKVVLASSAAGEESFLRSRNDSRRQLAGARYTTPELNLQELAENESCLLNLLESRTAGHPIQQYPQDFEFIRNVMSTHGLRDPTASERKFMRFSNPDEYGQVMNIKDADPGPVMNELLRVGRGYTQREEAGRLILSRQLYTYMGLRAIIEALEEFHPSATTSRNQRSRVPATKLIDQIAPKRVRPNFSGTFEELFKYPPLPSEETASKRRFVPDPANAAPSDLFEVQWNICTVPGVRFIRKGNRKQMLMFIDGACSNNQNQENARGGSAVVYTCLEQGQPIADPLHIDGNPHTSNRAELMAAIIPLGMRYWPGEGFNNIVLACDSEYVVKGITEWMPGWIKKNWRTSAGKPVKNKDLWLALLDQLKKRDKDGVLVQFWHIPREWNEADLYAKKAASMQGEVGPINTEYCLIQNVS